MSNIDSPIPLSEIESVLEWVDSFKLSRPTKKINRDFSDAVLLAEILSIHYPKLVEMHNYPPRNSHSLKLNNWLTLNRKVLKKLKLNLCINTMEQLANCHSGVIERVLVMVREKILRDEDLNKSMKDSEQNMSSGGSFYEACGEDENILVVPVKVRVNGVLETVQQKVVNYDSYLALKEELSDAKDSTEVLKQKVEHLDNLLKLKDERIEELQKQLDRKQARRKEAEDFQNSLQVPFETVQSPVVPTIGDNPPAISLVTKTSVKCIEPNKITKEESKIPVKSDSSIKSAAAHKNTQPDVKDNHGQYLKENRTTLGITNKDNQENHFKENGTTLVVTNKDNHGNHLKENGMILGVTNKDNHGNHLKENGMTLGVTNKNNHENHLKENGTTLGVTDKDDHEKHLKENETTLGITNKGSHENHLKENRTTLGVTNKDSHRDHLKENGTTLGITNLSYTKFPVKSHENSINRVSKDFDHDNFPQFVDNRGDLDLDVDVERIKSDVFKEVEITDEKLDFEELKDSEPGPVTTIDQTIRKEIKSITDNMDDFNTRVN